MKRDRVALSLVASAALLVASAVEAKQYIVEYTSGKKLDTLVVRSGGRVIRDMPGAGIAIVESESGAFAKKLRRNSDVQGVNEDVSVQWLPTPKIGSKLSNQPGPGAEGGFDPTTAFFYPYQWSLPITETDLAWGTTIGDPDVKVAILDTGICEHQIDLAYGKVDAANSVSFVSEPAGACAAAETADCADGCNAWEDYQFHGTHVAGIVGAWGFGTSGVAPDTTLRAVKVLNCNGSGTFGAIISGIIHAADTDNDVLNMSLGALFPKNATGAGSLVAALNKAVNYAKSKGTLVVSAAGNFALDLDHLGNYVSVPCQSGSGMCVGATDYFDGLTSYSNHGVSGPNLVAPGGDCFDLVNCADANDPLGFILAPCTTHSAILGGFGIDCSDGLSYLFVAGTSQAAPHVSGLGALLDSIAPGGPGSWDAAELRDRITEGADDLGKEGTDNIFSKGRMNSNNSVDLP